MNRSWWILLGIALLGAWNAGIIWLVQIAVYPLWPLVDAAHFGTFHLTWWHDMWPTFGPVVVVLLASIALLWIRPAGVPRWLIWSGILVQVVVHLLTGLYWAPIQAQMGTPQGISMVKYGQLMSTHWWRVLFLWAHAGLAIWMFVLATKHQYETLMVEARG